MAGHARRFADRDPERFTGGDPELVGDEVATGDAFGDRVLHLESRVHLEEGEGPALVDEELAGPDTDVADLTCERQGGVAEPPSQRVVDRRRGRLLEHLLVAALHGAIALAKMDAQTDGVEEDLDLDMAAPFDEPLEDQPAVAEGRDRLPARGGQLVRQAAGVTDDSHPLPATAGRRFDQEGVADSLRGCRERRVRLVGIVVAREHRNAERSRQPPRRRLVAHGRDGGRRRTNPGQAGVPDGFGEPGVLCQEADARVDGVCTRRPGRSDDRGDVEQLERARAVGGRHDRGDPEPARGARDSGGDLAAIGDEHGANGPPGPDVRTGHLLAPAGGH